MSEQSVQPEKIPRAGHDLSLWTAVLGAPVLWLCHLQTQYMLVPWACVTNHGSVLPLVSAGYILLTVVGGMLSWREFKNAGSAAPASTTAPAVGRSRLLSAVGMMSSALFSVAILAQAIATVILDPCSK